MLNRPVWVKRCQQPPDHVIPQHPSTPLGLTVIQNQSIDAHKKVFLDQDLGFEPVFIISHVFGLLGSLVHVVEVRKGGEEEGGPGEEGESKKDKVSLSPAVKKSVEFWSFCIFREKKLVS